DGLQPLPRETRFGQDRIDEPQGKPDRSLGIANHAGHFPDRAELAARVRDTHGHRADPESNAQVSGRGLVELEQPCTPPPNADGVIVADLVDDTVGDEIFDNRRNRRLRERRTARQIGSRDAATPPDDIEHDRAIYLPHRPAIDLALNVLHSNQGSGGSAPPRRGSSLPQDFCDPTSDSAKFATSILPDAPHPDVEGVAYPASAVAENFRYRAA